MGSTQSHVVSLSVCAALYFVYSHIYCSYNVLKTRDLHSDRLPSSVYLLMRYLSRCVSKRVRTEGPRAEETFEGPLGYTVHGCRLDLLLLRRFCSEAGYGWDYPDSEYRDLPLCFPEALCSKLLLMLLTDSDFRLCPAGLVRVRQSIQTLEPIDELKKGLFQLQASVLQYRAVTGGLEVDISLSATSRRQALVWESVLTLMSPSKSHRETPAAARSHSHEHTDGQLNPKQVELKARSPMMPCCSSDFSLSRVVSALFGFRPLITSRLWMLSVCLAEIEKHKGVAAVSAPATATAHFTERHSRTPGKVNVQFWDSGEKDPQCSQKIGFSLKSHGSSRSLMEGHIVKPVPE